MFEGIIYCAISPSNKKYYGQTVENFNKRKKRHYNSAFKYNKNWIFSRAIRKYGWNSILWKIVERIQANSISELKSNLSKREIYWIREDKTHDRRFGYNLTKGGDGVLGYKFTEEQYNKVCEFNRKSNLSRKLLPKIPGPYGMTGKHHSKETIIKIKQKMSGCNHPNFGKHHSAETIEKNRKSNTGKFLSEEHKNKIKNSLIGKIHILKEIKCPHCNLIGGGPNMIRYHMNNCKNNI